MNKLSGGGLLIAALALVFVGWLIQSDLLSWLLDLVGWVLIFGGIIVGVIGVVTMFTGGRRGSDF